MHKNFLKRLLAVTLTALTVMSGSSLSVHAAAGLTVQYHSIEDIKSKEKAIIPS